VRAVYLVCFDLSDDRVRARVGRELLKFGWRVQESVFEIMLDSENELQQLRERIRSLLDGETEVRFYRLCLNCRKESHRIDGLALAAFPAVVMV